MLKASSKERALMYRQTSRKRRSPGALADRASHSERRVPRPTVPAKTFGLVKREVIRTPASTPPSSIKSGVKRERKPVTAPLKKRVEIRSMLVRPARAEKLDSTDAIQRPGAPSRPGAMASRQRVRQKAPRTLLNS